MHYVGQIWRLSHQKNVLPVVYLNRYDQRMSCNYKPRWQEALVLGAFKLLNQGSMCPQNSPPNPPQYLLFHNNDK